ncbi:hypothetical protein [Streptomyces sp. NPDC056049]|uniref:hypothetical protein n=1 Tax=Streptomyces sp. NPDC056049 TaxID=3345693 RepID=UPI0035E0A94D
MNPKDADTPVGTWREEFSVEGEAKSGTLHFSRTGRAFILTGPANGGSGSGTWTATGENTFSYRIAERIVDVATGIYVGWVDIDHQAVQQGDSFTSTGVSRIYDADDALVLSVEMKAEGTRVEIVERPPLIL